MANFVIDQGIAVIALDNPPVNSLGYELRARIANALRAALDHPEVRGIVLVGTERAFSAGADIAEFGTPEQFAEPTLRTVIERIDAASKPVVAAITGLALGGGLELALACHACVAAASARVGLPEITLGLIPGAGATQRLPRLVGVDKAWEWMSTGQQLTAAGLGDSGLLDHVGTEDTLSAAVTKALHLADAGQPYPRIGTRVVKADALAAIVEKQRDKLTPRQCLQPAYGALLDALAACVLPIEQGLARERELFLSLVSTTAAKALRYQFQVEREATKLPTQWQARSRTVGSVAVIGAGTMGTGIAIAALDGGLSVLMLEQDEAALVRGRERILGHYRDRVTAGKIDSAVAAARQGRLTTSLEWSRLKEADLIIEAVFEELGVKQEVFRRVDAHARPGAVLATNTSYLDVDAIAAATSRPGDVVGLHFFSPANIMKLLEVVRGAATTPEVLATCMGLGVTLKKMPVLTGNAFGFIGNRIYNAYRRQCEFMLEDGAWPEDVDGALTGFGFAMGPFAVADLSGLDIAWRMRKAQAAGRDPKERYVAILDGLCEIGRLGRKTDAGYYTYRDGKQARTTDEVVRKLIQDASKARRVERRSLSATEIQRRALLAMVNEAALLFAEGMASRPSDIDVVLVQGYGFPRWEGGPVFWGRQQTRSVLEADMRALADQSGHGFVLGDLARLLGS